MSRPQRYKQSTSEQQAPPYKRRFDPKQVHTSKDRCSKCGNSKHVEGFKCPAKKYKCKSCHKYGHFTSLCFKKQVTFKPKTPKTHKLQAEEIYLQDDSVCCQSEKCTSSDDSFCLQMKIHSSQARPKLPTTSHLITNLAYKLKPHHKRNQYQRAHLDTCADVNIMPASVYKPVFHDPYLTKLAPRKLEIGTYPTDTVKLVGSCSFYLMHPDTK